MAISFPQLGHLRVERYGLYPGTAQRPGLSIDFQPGLTLILGANGLGKTTLITMAFRMLTGPSDISGLAHRSELGNTRIESTPLQIADRRTFSMRVLDGAADAEATLDFTLGDSRFVVTRQLRDLKLLTFQVNDVSLDPSEEVYQHSVLEASRLGLFGDWILLLRHLTFYFEDRRSLIWDSTAQREILRLLFLPATEGIDWVKRTREIISLDSLVRNLQYSLGKEERSYTRTRKAVGDADGIRKKIEELQELLAGEDRDLERINDELPATIARRQQARLNALTAEQTLESIVRNLERMQIAAVDQAFPDADTTMRYILGHILADGDCLTCGTDVPHFSEAISERIATNRCPICNSTIAHSRGRRYVREIKHARTSAAGAELQLKTAETERTAADEDYDRVLAEIEKLSASIARRSAQINDLVRRLPPGEKAVHQQRSELNSIRARLEVHRKTLGEMRASFDSIVSNVNFAIAEQKDAIKQEFDKFVGGFLVEEAELVWSPQKGRVGETGRPIEFASFELKMSGANFVSPMRRSGPEQVSESQREFIDLAFRMALMSVAAQNSGTLIIDAPESSLDAVFVRRAADVLSRFGNQRENRLVITSNLIDGDLIPELVRRGRISSARDRRVVDLLRLATPTAATKLLHDEYVDVRRRLFARARDEQ